MTRDWLGAIAVVLILANGACAGNDNAPADVKIIPTPASGFPHEERSRTTVTPRALPSAPFPALPTAPTPGAAGTSEATEQLKSLPAVDRHPQLAPYSREAFGRAWVDLGGNGCNQRDDVLVRDAEPSTVRVQQQGRCNHDVLAGTWVDPYTGRTMVFTNLKDRSQAQAIQIDHVVPLVEAWVSGAHGWDDYRRLVFANDLDNLLAVDGPTNARKGANDPAVWRPRKAYQCDYAKRWVAVKTAWGLAMDDSERAALTEMIGYCPA